ncbi:MAG: hypothetical protein A3H32_11210 [Betaproteobacteria bacterium RIFCSPLOWO2_02_FULL_63_19]|nr:MAG: hypothetical protein A3H32_11210 [Betaproteobacteria bacterium RIFCSPLOWO2_02_FULL_63_19]
MIRTEQFRQLAFTAALVSTLVTGNSARAQEALNFGTASVGSTYYVLSIGLSKLIGKYAGVNVNVQPVGGSYPNLFALASKKVDIVMANSLSQYDRYYGNKPFKNPYEIRMLAQGMPNYRVILVRRGANIKNVADLVGKTIIGKRRALPELEKITSALLRVHGIAPDKVNIVGTVNTGQVDKALRAGTVDAAAYPSARRQPLLTALFQDGIVDFLDLSREKRNEMLKLLPGAFYEDVFKAGTFPDQKKGAYVFGLATSLVARADMSDDLAYKIVKATLSHTDEFAKYHAAGRQWTVKQSLSSPSVPFHNGAIRYYKDVGAWTPAMDALQAKLLKR